MAGPPVMGTPYLPVMPHAGASRYLAALARDRACHHVPEGHHRARSLPKRASYMYVLRDHLPWGEPTRSTALNLARAIGGWVGPGASKMAGLMAFLALSVAGVGLLLAGLTAATALRLRSGRFVFASLAFAVFALEAGALFGEGMGWWATPLALNAWSIGADALVLALLYLAVVKR